MVTRLKQPHVSNSSTESSSEAMYSLNGDTGRKDITERRLTKPKTNSGTSLVSQRSIQPLITTPPLHPNGIRRETSTDTSANSSGNDGDEEPQLSVNDASRNLKDIWASVPRPTLRAHYKLHNPLGPRWYRNYHLIPPAHLKPSMRPPTFFSPSFPPIGTASPDYLDDQELDGSPSHSPLPTPESSQTRVQDGSKPRSRKTSQTAPDAIDMLDLSDPWGQNWHHKSPYEFGQTTVASLDTTDLPNRTRRASFSVSHTGQRSVAPSPLSQSTSAVNLPSLQPEIKAPRKLSKRKITHVTTVFQNSPPQVDRKATSVPATPIDAPVVPSVPLASDTLPKRMSMAPAGPLMTTPSPTPKREKRASFLNRLVKKFSTLKRGSEPILGGIEGWNYEASTVSIARRQSTAAGAANTFAFPEKPVVNGDSSGDQPANVRQEDDCASLSSLEIPYSVMGKLTVVNPDPSDEENEPGAPENSAQPSPKELVEENSSPLPKDDEEDLAPPEPPGPVLNDSPASPPDAELETSVDKPLPPRLGTPRFSCLVISEITVSTPQVAEQPLPPLPPKDVVLEESPIEREAAVSPPPDDPPEQPQPQDHRLSAFDPFHIVNLISLDHMTHEPHPVQRKDTLEGPNRALSRRKSTSPPKEGFQKPVVERKHTQSPSATAVQWESPSLSGGQSSKRNAEPPPEVTSTIERKTGNLHSNGRLPLSTRELARSKSPPRTRLPSNPRPETRGVPAPVQAPQLLVPFPASGDNCRLHIDSPLSASSVLANPPTPYDHRISINVSELSSSPPAVPPKSVRQQSPPPQKATKRETETFKLVRSSSGNVYASSQTILVQGQQWEVVESVEAAKDRSLRVKGKFKDQERERDTDREREREKEKELEMDRERERERQRAKERELEREKQKAREREMELQKEKAREREERERIEAERILGMQRERERARERAKERERREAERRQRELDMQREWERARERERREAEREKERQREREKERERERLKQRENRERERQREKERERERQREKERGRDREREKERERRKDRERREREREKEKERQRRREREREREERERREAEKEIERRVQEQSHEEDSHRERKSGHYDRKSREYERRSRDYEPRTDGSEHRSSRDEGKPRESERPTRYDHSSRRESRAHKHRNYEDSRPHDDHRHSRKYDERHDPRSTRYPNEMPSSSHSQQQPDPAVQVVSVTVPELQPVRLERIPSISARPVSQLPSANELNTVRAKEQWEMERLWKARSLYGPEPNGTVNHVIPGHSSNSSLSDDLPEIEGPCSPPQIHGSSHTAYLVQTPFQDSRTQIYHSMPTAPPPIYYHSPTSIPSIPDSLSSYEPYENLRFYPGPAQVAEPLPPSLFPPQPKNPLPEPPRESPYKPAPLSSISPSKRRSTEYWTFNGITTAH